MKGSLFQVDGRRIRISNLDKPFWPEDGVTKGDLLAYLLKVAPAMLPHLKDRPLVFTRYPDGIHGDWFYQKNLPDNAPRWLRNRSERRTIRFCLCDDVATLAWIASQGTIEIHPWLSRWDAMERPDFAVFDIDPAPPAGFDEARGVAFELRELLAKLGLACWPKTSGATGVHIYVPVERIYSYKQVRDFVEAVCRLMLDAMPDMVTMEREVEKRTGKVYLDYLQNVKGKTLVAPYCPRPLPGAPVSTPIEWSELGRLHPLEFSMRTVPRRVELLGDPFNGVLCHPQRLPVTVSPLSSPVRTGSGPRDTGGVSAWTQLSEP